MSTATVPEARESYFPHWKLKTTGVIMPEERLPWGQTIVSGMQHGVAMAGGTIIAPLIMGFDPNRALLFSGLGTLIFFVVVAGRVPSYLGSSFSFVAVVIAASGYSGHGPNPNLDVALGGIIAAGVLYGVIALIVMQSGIGWVERLMPPIVTGAAVAAIGLNLAPVAVKSVNGSQFDVWIGLFTVLIVGVIAVAAPGIWRRLPIICGAVSGYLLYLLLANGFGVGKPIDFAALAAAPWIGLPKFTGPSFHADAMFLIAPVAIILVAENPWPHQSYRRDDRQKPRSLLGPRVFGRQLWWPLVLTTNYDNVFEEAFAGRFPRVEGTSAPEYSVVGRSAEDCQRVLNSLTTAGHSLIWALQGYFDHPFKRNHHPCLHKQIVIGHEQYRRVTYREIHFRRAFAEVFRQRSLLFLGSGISETYLQDLFGEVIELFGPSTRPHYALLPDGAVDPDFMLSRFQITVATYTRGQHQQVVENLRRLGQAVKHNGDRQAAWSWRPAASLTGSAECGPGLKIVRAPLPLSWPGPGHCLVVSAGGSESSFFFSPGIQKILPYWGVQRHQQPDVAEKYLGVFYTPKATVYAVRARTEGDERALSSIYTATNLVLRKAAAKHSCINMQLIATGSEDSRGPRPFPPRFSLVEMVRAYAKWRRENPGAVCDVAIHIIDQAVSREIASGRIDISELLNCRDIRFWAEVVLDSGELERRLFQCMPDVQLCKVVGDINLPPDGWTVEVTPPPLIEEPKPQPIRPLLRSSLTELGVLPGSTLHFRRL